jgi:hypothetical protein
VQSEDKKNKVDTAFDVSDDPHCAAIVLAGFNVDPEHALEALGPGHGSATLGLRLL